MIFAYVKQHGFFWDAKLKKKKKFYGSLSYEIKVDSIYHCNPNYFETRVSKIIYSIVKIKDLKENLINY